MVRRWLAGGCAVAGVAVLAGIGWGLLVAAALLFLAPAPDALRVRAVAVTAGVVRVWRWLLSGRQAVAAAVMPFAVLGLGVGVGLAVGVGWGLAAAAVSVGGMSLAADRAASPPTGPPR